MASGSGRHDADGVHTSDDEVSFFYCEDVTEGEILMINL